MPLAAVFEDDAGCGGLLRVGSRARSGAWRAPSNDGVRRIRRPHLSERAHLRAGAFGARRFAAILTRTQRPRGRDLRSITRSAGHASPAVPFQNAADHGGTGSPVDQPRSFSDGRFPVTRPFPRAGSGRRIPPVAASVATAAGNRAEACRIALEPPHHVHHVAAAAGLARRDLPADGARAVAHPDRVRLVHREHRAGRAASARDHAHGRLGLGPFGGQARPAPGTDRGCSTRSSGGRRSLQPVWRRIRPLARVSGGRPGVSVRARQVRWPGVVLASGGGAGRGSGSRRAVPGAGVCRTSVGRWPGRAGWAAR